MEGFFYDPDGVKLLADRIVNDIIKELHYAYKREEQTKITQLMRQLELGPWCDILGVTPAYCDRLAKRYEKYKKLQKMFKTQQIEDMR